MVQDTAAQAGERKVQVLDVDFVNSDLTAVRNEYLFRTPILASALESLLKDERDKPLLWLQLNILQYTVLGIPFVFYMSFSGLATMYKHAIGLAYCVILFLVFLERFILMMHYSSHRPMYTIDFLNKSILWLMAPMFGVPCNLYKIHHCTMHHIENNHELDTTSTENYQRDSWAHFAYYWFRFVFCIWVELPRYCLITKKMQWFKDVVFGLSIWVASIFLLWQVSAIATAWVFVVPHFFIMTLMSFGNWSQHIFIDPTKPEVNHNLTVNCIDTPGNQTTFNDGYHILHHLNGRMHWSELPSHFMATKEEHRTNGALVFRQCHFFDIGIMVMTKNYRKLVEKHFVHCGTKENAPTIAEAEANLRRCVTRFPAVRKYAKKAN